MIIIGSGPAGYTAALYTARANLNPLVIEGFLWGGLLQQTTDVENYPGYPQGVMGPQMMQDLRDQAERFGTRFITENVTRVEPARRRRAAHRLGRRGRATRPRAVILAMGAEHKKLGVPGEEELGGRGVSYCATCDAAFFKDRATIIVGGGDSAMEEAIFLAKFSSKVDDRQPPRRVPRLEDHARARARDREHRVPDAVRGRGVPAPARTARWTARGCATSRPARREELPMDGAFIAIGHEPQSEIVDGHRRHRRGRLRGHRGQVDAHQRAGRVRRRRPRRPHLPPGGHRRRLGLQAALDAEWYLRDNPAVPTPAALEGTGDLAEEQWAPAAVLSADAQRVARVEARARRAGRRIAT